jgi:hypothetical protein
MGGNYGAGGGIRTVVTNPGDTATNQVLLAANAQRCEAIIVNDSSAVLYVKFGVTASSTDYTVKLLQDDVLQTEYRGEIDGIWASDAGGMAHVTEVM